MNFVFILSAESDLYFELLFLFSFLGITLGTFAGYVFQSSVTDTMTLLSFPLIGFCAGASLYHFRNVFLTRIAPKAARVRAGNKAKSLFYDHLMTSSSSTVMLYFSEIEKEAIFLVSPDLVDSVPRNEIAKVLKHLNSEYKEEESVKQFISTIEQLSQVLEASLKSQEIRQKLNEHRGPVFFIDSGQKNNPFPVPVIRGGDEIN